MKSWLRHRPACDTQPWNNNPPRPCTCGTADRFDRLIADLRASRANEKLLQQQIAMLENQCQETDDRVERLRALLDRHHAVYPGNWQVCEVCS